MKRILVAALAVASVTAGCANMNHEAHNDCKVTNKDVLQKVTGDKENTSTSFERRLATTCGTFIVQDSLVGGFDSYDTWNRLEVGKVYDIETGGFRVGLFGSFPTVTKVTAK